jgi:two-component system, response regulator PdtaR
MPNTRVLIVEDEMIVRLVGVDAAADAGYEVLEAGSADEALRIIEDAGDIQILFSDIRMPGSMNGLELAQLVHDRWPDIKILLTSGDTWPPKDAIPDEGRFLAKPYKLERLQRELDELNAIRP